MSKLKFAPDLFLEKQELDRFLKFLDEEGFRKNLIDETISWGFIDKQSFSNVNSVVDLFDNGLVTEDIGLTIKHNEIRAFNKDGELIYKSAEGKISVPANNLWYWIKISFAYSNNELGTWAIDSSGNLTGTGGELLTILRGEPNFPSRIKFTNASLNTQEYDIVEVIDNNNAILNGVIGTFNTESNLKLAVVGTFTEGVSPPSGDKYPFQYNSCIFTLVAESVLNTPPAILAGQEFIVARVKNSGVAITVQDKRFERWTTKANYRLQKVDEVQNPLIGIERIMFDQLYSTKDRNKVFVQWAFRSLNYSINSNLNMVTINAGTGGKFKTVADFTNGDFDGWRIYSQNGKYLRIVNSVKIGSQINCYLDSLQIDHFSTDGGNTFTGEPIIVTPDCEMIEIEFIPQDPPSTVIVETYPNLYERFEFNINEQQGICDLLVFHETESVYQVVYRYKTNDTYTEFKIIPDDNFGYLSEIAFEADGSLKPVVLSNTYAQNITGGFIKISVGALIELVLSTTAYYPLLQSILTGDRLGVDRVVLDPTVIQPYTLVVGSNRIYQYFETGPFSMTQDFFINLDNTNAINGNRFYLHFANGIVRNGYQLRIVTNFVNSSTFNLIEEISSVDESYQSFGVPVQFVIRHDGTQWQVEHSTYDRQATANSYVAIVFLSALLSSANANITALLAFQTSASANISTLQVFQADVEDVWITQSIPITDCNVNGAILSVPNSSWRYKVIGKICFLQLQCNVTVAGAPVANAPMEVALPTGIVAHASFNLTTVGTRNENYTGDDTCRITMLNVNTVQLHHLPAGTITAGIARGFSGQFILELA